VVLVAFETLARLTVALRETATAFAVFANRTIGVTGRTALIRTTEARGAGGSLVTLGAVVSEITTAAALDAIATTGGVTAVTAISGTSRITAAASACIAACRGAASGRGLGRSTQNRARRRRIRRRGGLASAWGAGIFRGIG
ncbi:MAG: hypothetical protein RSB42_06355, partial [Comamonas sp.]